MSELNPFTPASNPCRNSSGFTLIEILVTIVVVSIGLLGLAGLQINGLRANMSSEARSKATLLANDIVERMRANPSGVETGAYNNIAINAANCVAPAMLCGNTSTSDAVDCTTAEMAAFDAWEWGCGTAAPGVQGGGVINQLPGGTASIACVDNDPGDAFPCTPGSLNTIIVNWSEGADANAVRNITLTIVP